ncbi:hypothetical protein WG66_007582 [Moniliophthora roreri]|nr:hypothetical protein WG66_007582 [Moniliophthora roreri]
MAAKRIKRSSSMPINISDLFLAGSISRNRLRNNLNSSLQGEAKLRSQMCEKTGWTGHHEAVGQLEEHQTSSLGSGVLQTLHTLSQELDYPR